VCNYEDGYLLITCFGLNRTNLSLNRFLSACKSHVSKNRLVRWFADYNETSVDCSIFTQSKFDLLLQNAKQNLLKISYFGIAEYQRLSYQLFEATFKGLKFNSTFNASQQLQEAELVLKHMKYKKNYSDLSESLLNRIKAENSIDIKFYEFALEIFFNRLKAYGITY
jgi:hypothetical protein